jgi:hypothetical protein
MESQLRGTDRGQFVPCDQHGASGIFDHIGNPPAEGVSSFDWLDPNPADRRKRRIPYQLAAP